MLTIFGYLIASVGTFSFFGLSALILFCNLFRKMG